MIAERELLRRFSHEMNRVRFEPGDFAKGFYEGIKLCVSLVKILEAETQKHLYKNPKAVTAVIARINKAAAWSSHFRWTLHPPKRKAA